MLLNCRFPLMSCSINHFEFSVYRNSCLTWIAKLDLINLSDKLLLFVAGCLIQMCLEFKVDTFNEFLIKFSFLNQTVENVESAAKNFAQTIAPTLFHSSHWSMELPRKFRFPCGFSHKSWRKTFPRLVL